MKSKVLLSQSELIYKLNKNISSFKGTSLNEYTINLFILFIVFAFLFIMYIKIDITIDEKNWNINKCNPKYLFFSGYIKSNPGSSSSESTVNNFYDCAKLYSSGINDTLNLPLDNMYKKMKNKLITFDKRQLNEEKKNRKYRKKYRKNLSRQINELENDISLNITTNSAFTYKYLKNVGYYIDHLNSTMDYITQYAKNYLTYLMLYYANRYREDDKPELKPIYYKNTIKLNNIIKQYL
jgi:hypothetical protein